jgi:hypothetical protein
MRRKFVFPAVMFGLGAASVASAGPVDFRVVFQSVAVNKTDQSATFTLTFDREPNFTSVDDGQVEAFQYEIDADRGGLGSPIEFEDVDTVIRGGEIAAGEGIPVREREGFGGPRGGGWGPVKAFLPFNLQGNTLSFTAPLAAIGDDDGKFRYRVITTENGGMTGEVKGAVIPLPAAVWSGMMLLGGVGIIGKFRRKLAL